MGSVNAEVFVRLDDAKKAELAESMASKIQRVEQLRTKKKVDAKATQAQIDAELDNLASMARIIADDGENRKQGELFVGDGEAQSALAEVAKRATPCTDRADVTCPLHGECACKKAEGADGAEIAGDLVDTTACPLHAEGSTHGQEQPQADPVAEDRVGSLAAAFVATLPENYDGGVHDLNRRLREWCRVQEDVALAGINKAELRERVKALVGSQPAVKVADPAEPVTEEPAAEGSSDDVSRGTPEAEGNA